MAVEVDSTVRSIFRLHSDDDVCKVHVSALRPETSLFSYKLNNNIEIMPKRKRTASKATKKSPDDGNEGKDIVGGLKDPTGDSRSTGSEANNTSKKTNLKIPFEDSKQVVAERHHASPSRANKNPQLDLVFTHGAGGGVANPATQDFVTGFASASTSDALCFQGTMNLSHRTRTFHAVLANQGRARALGGRSMGSRASVITATECTEAMRPEAVILVSYPLTSEKGTTKGGEDPRRQILRDLPGDVDVLFVTGEKDGMCDLAALDEVRGEMSARSWVVEVKGADHGMSFAPKGGVKPVRLRTGKLAAEWLQNRDSDARYCSVEWSKEDEEVIVGGWQPGNSANGTTSKKKRKR